MSTALLSLPLASTKAVSYPLAVPAHLRARAGQQLRRAVLAGRIAATDVAKAAQAGDAGISELMHRHHVLRHDLQMPVFDDKPTLDAAPIRQLVSWARHLREAGRLRDATLAAITREDAFEALLTACLASVEPTRPVPASASAPNETQHRFYAVYTSFAERIYDNQYAHGQSTDTTDEPPTITVEPQVVPFVDLPACASGADEHVLHAALQAISAADPLGLWITPRDVPHIRDGWFIEHLTDAAREAKKRPDGTPIFTGEHIESMAEEFGMDIEDPDAACRSMEAHYAHLRRLETMPAWKPGSARMKVWLKANVGTPLHGLVTRLLGIAASLRRIDLRRQGIETDYEGDCVGLMVAAPTPPDLHMFDSSFEQYGQGDTPQLRIRLADDAKNPSAFWKLHEDVVMVVQLISEAANAILSYEKRLRQPG